MQLATRVQDTRTSGIELGTWVSGSDNARMTPLEPRSTDAVRRKEAAAIASPPIKGMRQLGCDGTFGWSSGLTVPLASLASVSDRAVSDPRFHNLRYPAGTVSRNDSDSIRRASLATSSSHVCLSNHAGELAALNHFLQGSDSVGFAMARGSRWVG